MQAQWRTAWITGASSGIGRELAIALAERGVTVAASARSGDTLAEMARAHKGIAPLPLDVTDAAAVAGAARSIAGTLGDVDLAVLNAGIWETMSAHSYSAGRAAHSMAVNYTGIANCLEVLLPPMLARGSGHIALMSSLAGYRGLGRTAAYGPSKAAVINLAESLRVGLLGSGVTISVINPGFVATPMSANNKFPMPFIVPVEEAVQHIIRGLERGKYEIAFPWQLAAFMKLLRLMPNGLFFWYARTFMRPRARKG
jgi:short-subunit dehydrogenase